MKWISDQYFDEREFQSVVNLELWNMNKKLDASTWGNPERQCTGSKSRVDFDLEHLNLFLELKIDVKATSMDRAVGQALRYAVIDMRRTWIVLPDDLEPPHGYRDVMDAIGGDIVKFSELIPRLKSAPEWFEPPKFSVDHLRERMLSMFKGFDNSSDGDEDNRRKLQVV